MATTNATVTVIGGVDTHEHTHKHTHYAAAIDERGQLLGDREFSATDDGYRALLGWLSGLGQVHAIGVESTGSFGAALARALTKAGEHVVEVNRPNRLARRMDGKSDRLDAEQIARAVLGQTSTATPKAKDGVVEVIRTLRVTRSSAVKARTQAFNTLFGVMIGAPWPLRDELVALTKRTLVNRCLRLRPETDDLLSMIGDPERLRMAGVKSALRDLARRWKTLDGEVAALNKQLETLVRAAAPALVELHGVGVEIAAPLDEHRSIERFHRTLADGWAYARFYDSETERRDALPAWLHFYNHRRAHSAIGGRPPVTRLTNLPGHHT